MYCRIVSLKKNFVSALRDDDSERLTDSPEDLLKSAVKKIRLLLTVELDL
jgi:hypothetical protein